MKKGRLSLIVISLTLLVGLLSGCKYVYTSGPTLPSTIGGNSSFEASFAMRVTEGDTSTGDSTIFNIGIKVPESFIPSGNLSQAISSFTIHSFPPPGSPLSPITSMVVFDPTITATFEARLPPGAGYRWWGGTASHGIYRLPDSRATGDIKFASTGSVNGNFTIGVASYYVWISLAWVSSNESHTISVDTQAPVVSISSPSDGDMATFQSITVTGTASDSNGVSRVRVRTATTAFADASLSGANWSISLTLEDGNNTIEAKAIDNFGNESAVTKINVKCYPHGLVSAAPESLNFIAPDASDPPSQTLNIESIGGEPVNWSCYISPAASWLSITPSNGTGSAAVTVTAITQPLPKGTYYTNIIITPGSPGAPSVTVPVSFEVCADPPTPTITIDVAPSALLFTTAEGGGTLSKTLSIARSDGELSDWTASSNVPWLAVDPSGTGSEIIASADTSGLAEGSYYGAITVSDISAANGPVTIPVTLDITPAIAVNSTTPLAVGVARSHPNPFNPTKESARIIFNIAANRAKVIIYDLRGKPLAVKLAESTTGYYEVPWDGRSDAGEAVSNGTYIYLITAENKVLAKGQIMVWK